MSVPMSVSSSTGTRCAATPAAVTSSRPMASAASEARRAEVEWRRIARRFYATDGTAGSAPSAVENGGDFCAAARRHADNPAAPGTGSDVPPLAAVAAMLARVRTAALSGLDAVLVFAEVDVSNGFPTLTLVG